MEEGKTRQKRIETDELLNDLHPTTRKLSAEEASQKLDELAKELKRTFSSQNIKQPETKPANHTNNHLESVFAAGYLIGYMLYLCMLLNKLADIEEFTHPELLDKKGKNKNPLPDFFKTVFLPFLEKFRNNEFRLRKETIECLVKIFTQHISITLRWEKISQLFDLLAQEDFFRDQRGNVCFKEEFLRIKESFYFSDNFLGTVGKDYSSNFTEINNELKKRLESSQNLGSFLKNLGEIKFDQSLAKNIQQTKAAYPWAFDSETILFPIPDFYRDYFARNDAKVKTTRETVLDGLAFSTNLAKPYLPIIAEMGFIIMAERDSKNTSSISQLPKKLLGNFPHAPTFKTSYPLTENDFEQLLTTIASQSSEKNFQKEIREKATQPSAIIEFIVTRLASEPGCIFEDNPLQLYLNFRKFLLSSNKIGKPQNTIRFWTILERFYQVFKGLTKITVEQMNLLSVNTVTHGKEIYQIINSSAGENNVPTDVKKLAAIRLLLMLNNLDEERPAAPHQQSSFKQLGDFFKADENRTRQNSLEGIRRSIQSTS